MSEPFLAEINLFPYTFAPRGWSYCEGATLAIAQNTALYSVIGTNYGGDGRQTFDLPDLEGRAAMGWGQGPGLSYREIGDSVGSTSVTLAESNLPDHTHTAYASLEYDQSKINHNPTNKSYPAIMSDANSTLWAYKEADATLAPMADDALAYSGGGQSHPNIQPILTLYYFIAFDGIYPSRS